MDAEFDDTLAQLIVKHTSPPAGFDGLDSVSYTREGLERLIREAYAAGQQAQRERDAKIAEARALRKQERFELGVTHNTRCEEADVIACTIRQQEQG